MIKEIVEKINFDGETFAPKDIKFNKFKAIMTRGKFEGIVFMGAGGDQSEWIEGITGLLKQEDIIKTGEPRDTFMGAYKLMTTGGRTDLALVFNNKQKDIDMGKLAMWRLKFGDASWVSDYVVNYADQH